MPDRPYILLSCGMSIDGYLDNASSQRLLLSNQDDLERVDAVRARATRSWSARRPCARTTRAWSCAASEAATSGCPGACRRRRPR